MDNNEHMFEDETTENASEHSGNTYGDNGTNNNPYGNQSNPYGSNQGSVNGNPYGNPYGNAGQNNGNPYGGSGQNNQYSYNSNPYTNGQTGPQVGPNGKKLGVGFGVASLVLGIISLLCFCSGVNVILAILAIVFGVIQIVTCEKKGMAIGGIATAVISVVLLVITWGLLFSNAAFMDMMQEEMQNDFEDDEDMQQFFEQYGIDMNGEDDTL